MKLKFTIIDYIIIILIIAAVVFAFVHITADDSGDVEKTAFDESTINKIPDTYFKYYKEGLIVTANIEGFNASNNEPVSVQGEVIWLDTNNGGDVKLLIKSNDSEYLTGFYRYNPNADIYIDHISLENNHEKYENLTEIKTNGKEINSLNELIEGIDNNTNFEISTKISLDSLNEKDMQKAVNKLFNEKRPSIKSDVDAKVIITRATKENINDADLILGNIDGVSEEIIIRIYNSTESDIKNINNNYDVININRFK